ncbi:MAG: dethiobiotin synthase [Helicobacteraceae bacterium 4484_230]|nr:MAG: dethiobiotin synthase [Helicobacteraceae bacterium 4484_230]
MIKRIFITATNTNIGKTYATKLLMGQFSKMGYRVGVIKPIETGVETNPADATELLDLLKKTNPEAHELTLKDVVPICFKLPAAPYIANHANNIDLAPVHTAIAKQEKISDILLIEGAGGLFVPIDRDMMMIDLIERLEAKTLLVSHCRLGCINDTLLSRYALKKREIKHYWTLNCHDNDTDFSLISEPFFKEKFPGFTILKQDIEKVALKLLSLFEK